MSFQFTEQDVFCISLKICAEDFLFQSIGQRVSHTMTNRILWKWK